MAWLSNFWFFIEKITGWSICSNREDYLAFNLAWKAWGQHPSLKEKMAVTAFLQALNFAVVECDVSVVFKVAQVRALEAVYLGRDVIGILPTGYGKSLIFQLIPDLISFKRHTMSSDQTWGRGDVQRDSVIIVVCPLRTVWWYGEPFGISCVARYFCGRSPQWENRVCW